MMVENLSKWTNVNRGRLKGEDHSNSKSQSHQETQWRRMVGWVAECVECGDGWRQVDTLIAENVVETGGGVAMGWRQPGA
jgi:hypothetical protein